MLYFETVTLGQSAASSTQKGPPVAAEEVTRKMEPDQKNELRSGCIHDTANPNNSDTNALHAGWYKAERKFLS